MFRLATKIFVTKQKEKDGSIFIGFLVPKEGWWVDGFWNSCVDPSWQQATESLKPTNDEASAFRREVVLRYSGAEYQMVAVVLTWAGVVLQEGQAVFQGGNVDRSV